MNNFTFKKQFWLLSGSLMLGIAILSLATNHFSRIILDNLFTVSNVQLPAVRNMTLIDMMHDGFRGLVFESVYKSSINDQKSLDSILKELPEKMKDMKDYIDILSRLNLNPSTKIEIENTQPLILKYTELTNKIVQMAATGQLKSAEKLLPEFNEIFETLEGQLEKLGKLIIQDSEKNRDTGSHAITFNTLFSSLILLIGAILSFFIVKKVNHSITNVSNQLSKSVDNISKISKEVETVSLQVASSSIQQASAVQESVASISEISSMVRLTSENSKNSYSTAQAVSEMSSQGRSIMEKVVLSMNAIEQSNKDLQNIANIIEEIGTKTSVINDIVFKTQLLSFNASIEAARAGQQGRGFAVVAEEVGSLALMSGDAAKVIQELLVKSRIQVQETLGLIRSRVKEGNHVSDLALKSFHQIAEEILKIQEQVKNTTDASIQQELGLGQSTKAMTELDSVSRKNQGLAESAQSSSRILENEITELTQILYKLEKMVGLNVENTDKNNYNNVHEIKQNDSIHHAA